MITLECNYSKKLGLPGYSSHQFAITLRTEIADLNQVQAERARLYKLLQEGVDTSSQQVGFLPAAHGNGNGNGNGQRGGQGHGSAQTPDQDAWNCSDKQKNLILRTVEEHKLEKAKVNSIETLQKTVSASRFTTFLQCRLKFFFRYVQQISKPKTPSLHVGSVVHLILQAWNMARWRRQEFNRDNFKGLFEERWKDQPPGIRWDGEEAGEKNTAWSVLEMYFAETPIKANEMPEAVEVPMETDLSKYGLPTLIGVGQGRLRSITRVPLCRLRVLQRVPPIPLTV